MLKVQLTLYLVAIEARSHGGTWKTVRNRHVYHSHDHIIQSSNPEKVVQYPVITFSPTFTLSVQFFC